VARILPSMAAQARRILVGFDGSEAAWRALDVAAQLTGYGSTLAVATVASEGNGGVRNLLDAAHERLLEQHVTATYVGKVGDPAEELVCLAHELGADLVVVGRRGERSDGAPLTGSVSAEVVRDAPCDVLVIR
jgi:nucleotide-binding universal stress UspA family protein